MEALAQYRMNHNNSVNIIAIPDITAKSDAKAADIELLAECLMPIARGDKYLGEWTVR